MADGLNSVQPSRDSASFVHLLRRATG